MNESSVSELTAAQLATLTELLESRERSLESSMQEHVVRLRSLNAPDPNAPVGDVADLAEIEIERDKENTAVERGMRELHEIEVTRARIATGEAGACIDCGEPIGFERLMVQPTALRCVECQEQAENPLLSIPDSALPAERTGRSR